MKVLLFMFLTAMHAISSCASKDSPERPSESPGLVSESQPSKSQPTQRTTLNESEGTLQTASLEGILAEITRVAPRIVDPTGSGERAPGLVVGVVTAAGRKVIGFGSTELKGGHQPDGDTQFGIGSVTKVFTGLALAEAVLRGAVALDDSANKYLPADLQLPNNAITLRQLAIHTSGLPNFPSNLKVFRDLDSDGVNDSAKFNPGRNYSRKNLADWLQTKPRLEFEPGQRALYSNLGTGVLSIALQTRLKFENFDAMNRALVTQPLGMANTHANDAELGAATYKNRAQGYAPEGDGLLATPHADMGVLNGAGKLVSTANDLLKFLENITGITQSSLTPSLQESCRSLGGTGERAMAYSIEIKPSTKGGVYYLKPGGTGGFSAIILWRTSPKIGLVLLANRGSFKKVNEFGMKLIEAAVR